MDSLKKEKQSLINKIFLIIVDALSVVLCSFLGLLMRFEMDVSHIPGPYVMAVERMIPAYRGNVDDFLGFQALSYALALCQLQGACRDRRSGGGFYDFYDNIQLFYLQCSAEKLFCDLLYLSFGLRLYYPVFVDYYTDDGGKPESRPACPKYNDYRRW